MIRNTLLVDNTLLINNTFTTTISNIVKSQTLKFRIKDLCQSKFQYRYRDRAASSSFDNPTRRVQLFEQSPTVPYLYKIHLRSNRLKQLKLAHSYLSHIAANSKIFFAGPVKRPLRKQLISVIRSPHINKTSMEQFYYIPRKWSYVVRAMDCKNPITVDWFLMTILRNNLAPGVQITYERYYCSSG